MVPIVPCCHLALQGAIWRGHKFEWSPSFRACAARSAFIWLLPHFNETTLCWSRRRRAPWPALSLLTSDAGRGHARPPRVLNAMAKVSVTHLPMSSISHFIMHPDPCGLQQVKSVWPSGPPRFALAIAPPLPVSYPYTSLLHPSPHTSRLNLAPSITAHPPTPSLSESIPPLPARSSALPARVLHDISLPIDLP
ncbi:hypothetical protein B0H16DRAFT_1607758 [Mycena metata]|uniref:Uncharacterized protein n=1 Tax=Mycena metata TaxID=1033252 RepID=A0AAD7HG30_9AGAR|nr:hypothetical protein B0H16DRAFT_1607758 [Mycena metata]